MPGQGVGDLIKYLILSLMLITLNLTPALAQDPLVLIAEIEGKIAAINGFSATVETSETAQVGGAAQSGGRLTVSRQYGWKMVSDKGPEPSTTVADFKTFYQFFPRDRRVMKLTADNDELRAMMIKPITDMNPLVVLNTASIIFKGSEILDGETVHRFEGTTETQLMPGGPRVMRKLDAWISTADGLPRKTVESVGSSEATTVYRDVKVNPPLTAEDFQFQVPDGAIIIDANKQMKQMEDNLRQGREALSEP